MYITTRNENLIQPPTRGAHTTPNKQKQPKENHAKQYEQTAHTGTHTIPQEHIPFHRNTHHPTGTHTIPQEHIPFHRNTYHSTGTHTIPQEHIPFHRNTYHSTGTHTIPQEHIPFHRNTHNSTGTHTIPQEHIPFHRNTYHPTGTIQPRETYTSKQESLSAFRSLYHQQHRNTCNLTSPREHRQSGSNNG